jgi:hypothetical protein
MSDGQLISSWRAQARASIGQITRAMEAPIEKNAAALAGGA